MKMKKIDISKCLNNSKVVAFLSLVISFCIWVGMSLNTGEDFSKRITDIPITIELSDAANADNLRVFSGYNETAEVYVTGNRLSVGSLTASDIQIVAQQASTITSPGNYTLELSAKKLGFKSDYEFTSTITPSFVTITVDRYREIAFDITNNLNYKIADGYYESPTQYSSDKVVVSGPETEVSKVDRVAVKGEISGELSETVTVDQHLILLDEYGDEINSEQLSIDVDSVAVTIPVDLKKTVALNIELLNAPQELLNHEGFIEILPNEIEIAGPKKELENVAEVAIGKIDMSIINLSTTSKKLDVELPSGLKNLSNLTSANVKFDMSGFTSNVFKVTNFEVKGASSTSKASVTTKSINVTVIGQESAVSELSASDITAVVDLSKKGQDYSGSAELPVTIEIKNNKLCWAYGSYTVSVNVLSQ